MVVQKGDFIKLSYTGKLENGTVFDTTDANVAKENAIYNEQASYGPETVVVGKGFVVAGLDEDLIGKDVGEKGTVTVPPEKGFGLRRIDVGNLWSEIGEVQTDIQLRSRFPQR